MLPVDRRLVYDSYDEAVKDPDCTTTNNPEKPVPERESFEAEQRQPRRFGAMQGKIVIHDPDWAKPQNDIEAWLAGDV